MFVAMSNMAPGTLAPTMRTSPLAAGAVLVLKEAGKPMSAPDLIEAMRQHGELPSTAKEPARSLNRDLHIVARSSNGVVQPGPRRGTFVFNPGGSHALEARAVRAPRRAPSRNRLPLEPLAAHLDVHSPSPLSASRGRAWLRARERGYVSLYLVDEICVKDLGVHPALVYGMSWWDVLESA